MQTDNNHNLRRIRLISDILEDYQDNIRRALRLIETEQSMISQDTPANHTYGNIFVNTNARGNLNSSSNPTFGNIFANTNARGNLNSSSNPTFGNILVNTNDRGNLNNYIHFQTEDPAPIHRTAISDSSRSEFIRYTHNATTQITWDESMHQLQCPITWDSFTPGQSVLRINGCGHIFSRDAIVEWFRRRNHCPVCRSLPVLTDQPRNYGNSPTPLSNSYNIAITVDPGIDASDVSGNIRAQQEYNLSTNNSTMDSIINNLTTAILRRLEFGRDQEDDQNNSTLVESSPPTGESENNIIRHAEYYNDQLLFLTNVANAHFNDDE